MGSPAAPDSTDRLSMHTETVAARQPITAARPRCVRNARHPSGLEAADSTSGRARLSAGHGTHPCAISRCRAGPVGDQRHAGSAGSARRKASAKVCGYDLHAGRCRHSHTWRLSWKNDPAITRLPRIRPRSSICLPRRESITLSGVLQVMNAVMRIETSSPGRSTPSLAT
jgi:hypothetical protein